MEVAVRQVLMRYLKRCDANLRHHVFIYVLRALCLRQVAVRDLIYLIRNQRNSLTVRELDCFLHIAEEKAALAKLFDGRYWRDVKFKPK